jgi:predicted metalloprotease with PDZ domain
MRDDLLWIYEGLTQYWGNVLTARAGMRSAEQTATRLFNIRSETVRVVGRPA